MSEVHDISIAASLMVDQITQELAVQRGSAHDQTTRMERISVVIKTNAEVAQMVATSSEQMNKIAQTVQAEVGFFKLK